LLGTAKPVPTTLAQVLPVQINALNGLMTAEPVVVALSEETALLGSP
jgi:hypothetical protein